MKYIKFTYRGDRWNAYIISDDEGESIFDNSDDAAQVHFDKKEIYFNTGYINEIFVRHEILHMATQYQYVKDCELSFHQSEEFFCGLFGNEGKALVDLSDVLYNNLIKLRDSSEEELVINLDEEL